MADETSTNLSDSKLAEVMSEWMVVIDRPDPDALASYDRGQKFRLLQENSAARRDELVDWLANHGLTDQVASVGEPTTFNVLFVTATSRAAQRLTEAPGVLGVSQTAEFKVDLPKPDRGSHDAAHTPDSST
jgi:hypothetical protein